MKSVSQPGLAARRRALGLQQAELAVRCGVTRQFLGLVEAGRTQPNVQVALRLAEVLGCTVEDLFRAERVEAASGLPVRLVASGMAEGARLNVARVGERWVGMAADTVESLGRGFAQADAVLRWSGDVAEARPHRAVADLEKNIALGGCDPALGLLQHPEPAWGGDPAGRLPGRCLWMNCGNGRALRLLAEGWVHLAGLHHGGAEADANLREVRRLDPSGAWEVFHFTRWENGWMLRPGVRGRFRGAADFVDGGFRLANREPGAGNRSWLDAELARAGVEAGRVAGYGVEHVSHWDCARALADGRADVAVGPRAIAKAFGLDFIAAEEVRFDLVVPRMHVAHPGLQALLHRVRSRAFQAEVETLAGYRAAEAGSQAR